MILKNGVYQKKNSFVVLPYMGLFFPDFFLIISSDCRLPKRG